MILGIGLDLCGVERIEDAIARQHFLERVYTPAEQARLKDARGVRRGEIAAGLFAAKEAVAKALGTGFSSFGPWDIEITPDDLGCPACTLSGPAAARADSLSPSGWRVHITITHDGGMAAAVAILEG